MSSLNSPYLVAAAGTAVLVGLPTLELSAASLAVLKGANLLALMTNVFAVSVPGRLDGQQDQAMRSGDLNPSTSPSSSSPLVDRPQEDNRYLTFSRKSKDLENYTLLPRWFWKIAHINVKSSLIRSFAESVGMGLCHLGANLPRRNGVCSLPAPGTRWIGARQRFATDHSTLCRIQFGTVALVCFLSSQLS